MQLWVCAIAAAAVCIIFTSPAASLSQPGYASEPLCGNKRCSWKEVCRVAEVCQYDYCQVKAVCVPKDGSGLSSYGCKVGGPLLSKKYYGGYELRSCHSRLPCPRQFSCDSLLQDAPSRCCRTSTAPLDTRKRGECPKALPVVSNCVSKCNSDADCRGSAKCCQFSQYSSNRACLPPHPCSLKNCPKGLQCLVDRNDQARCVTSIYE